MCPAIHVKYSEMQMKHSSTHMATLPYFNTVARMTKAYLLPSTISHRSHYLHFISFHFQFISVNLVYKDMENVMFIILGVTKHIYKENNNYKQQYKHCCRYVINMHY